LPIHVLDDEISITEFIAEVLNGYGKEIQCFYSAEEYLTKMNSEAWVEPRLIVSDVQMGGMDGFDLIKTLRSKGLKAKVIMMSGFNSHFNEPFRDSDYTLSKPFHPDELIVATSRLLG